MKRVTLLSLVLAALTTTVVAQNASVPTATKPIPLEMKSTSITDPSAARYWTDYLKIVDTSRQKPLIWVGRASVAKADVIVTMLQAGEWCGTSKCAVRVFMGGKLTNDLTLCADPASYALLPNGKSLVACKDIVDLAP